MLAAQGGGERETGRGPDAVVGQRESRARLYLLCFLDGAVTDGGR